MIDEPKTPVVLIGTSREDGSLQVVGLYESQAAAQRAVHSRDVPENMHYSVMTPGMNSYTAARRMP